MYQYLCIIFTIILVLPVNGYYFLTDADKYGSFSKTELQELVKEAKEMFYFGYDNYMKFAFNKDELDPIHCTGRGSDRENPYVIFILSRLL